MIFRRSLLREMANLAVAAFLTLYLVALTTRLVRLLGQAAGGKIPSDAVLAFLGFYSLQALPVLLSLTLFIAVLLTLSRLWRDSEMIVWLASGVSFADCVRPVLAFAAPIIGVIAVFTFAVSPWAVAMSERYRARLDARHDIARVEPGVFGESRWRERTFFVESVAGDLTSVRNVFVHTVQHGRTGVTMSEHGHTETSASGDRFLVLTRGRRYEAVPGEAEYRVMEFERYAIRIMPREGEEPVPSAKALTTMALVAQPIAAHLGELVWRIGIPVSALLLALAAIPLSVVNPRAGRSVNLVLALLVYVTYANLLSVAQARVAQGKLAFATGLWVVHAAMLVLLTLLFLRRLGAGGMGR